MSEAATLKAITANRLTDGAVVYLADGGAWRETLRGCRLAQSAEECAAMEEVARWAASSNLVVGPYAIDVTMDDAGAARPASLREAIRIEGPTVRPDLGRAEG
jgi:hypothetical protein